MEDSKRAPSEKSRTQPRDRTYVETEDLQSALERIRQVACRDKELRFTSLWHHVTNIDRLRQAYFGLKRNAAPGVDGVTWQQYGESREENLQDLSARLKRGAYRAKPVRRAYIPKADGRQRPLGVTALEDKIVQRSTVQVLNAIYETDFLGFSYGFRRGRSPHHALDALYVGIMRKRVNWVLDADVCGFFDAIDHKWLLKFIEHRIADPRVIRHLKKWLKAGIVEDGKRTEIESGTPKRPRCQVAFPMRLRLPPRSFHTAALPHGFRNPAEAVTAPCSGCRSQRSLHPDFPDSPSPPGPERARPVTFLPLDQPQNGAPPAAAGSICRCSHSGKGPRRRHQAAGASSPRPGCAF